MTRLLSQALGGNSLSTIVCTVSPASLNYQQTLSTLRFASRAKLIKVKAVVNEYVSEKTAIDYYKNQIQVLQEQLERGQEAQRAIVAENVEMNNKNLIKLIMKNNDSLHSELSNVKEMYSKEKERNDKMMHDINELKRIVEKLERGEAFSVKDSQHRHRLNALDFEGDKQMTDDVLSDGTNDFYFLEKDEQDNVLRIDEIKQLKEEYM